MPLISITLFIPLLAGVLILGVPKERPDIMKVIALVGSLLSLVGSVWLLLGLNWQRGGGGGLQWQEQTDWIPSLGASYHLAIDGISAPLIALSALLTVAVVIYSWQVKYRVKEYFFLFLLLETGLLGVFAAQDLLLFYLFFEVSLVPMYFIIGVWGGERRTYAAIKFFLYTRVGSLAMLLSFLALYLTTNPHTFDLPTIIKAQPFAGNYWGGTLVLLGLFLGFAIKLPAFPLHSWLPDAHVEAPTGGSVILAGALLKLGGYGFIRIGLPTIPQAFNDWAIVIIIIALISIIYGAGVALVQPDFKKLVAFSSINHMGYVLLGVGIGGSQTASAAARLAALNGAVLQMVSHGLITGALFFLVGFLYDRTHSHLIADYKGLWNSMPIYSGLTALAFFGSLGLPALSGFVAEFQVFLGTLAVYPWAAALALIGVIVTTAMFLWTLQRMFLGGPTTQVDMPSQAGFEDSWDGMFEPGSAPAPRIIPQRSPNLADIAPPTLTLERPQADTTAQTDKNSGSLPEIKRRELIAVVPLLILTVLIGIIPGALIGLINAALTTAPLGPLAGLVFIIVKAGGLH